MASNRDILEAQRFNRKRLVTAFSSGMPEGRELEPKSRTTPLVVGVVLTVLILVVAAAMGRFSPTLPEGWQNNTVIIVKGTGARYFTIDGVLRPITNVTSARLLSEPGKYTLSEVGSSAVAGVPRGSQIGIVGAPDDVPSATTLHSDQWSACVVDGATRTWIGTLPPGIVHQTTVLVENEGHRYVVVDGIRHSVSESSKSGVVLALGLEDVAAHPVGADWLALFDEGSEFKPLEMKDAGKAVSGMPASLGAAVRGSVVEVTEGSSLRRFIVVGDGEIAPLSDVAWALYQISPSGLLVGKALTASVADIADLDVAAADLAPADWPQELGTPLPDDSSPCVSLSPAGEQPASVSLGALPTGAHDSEVSGATPTPNSDTAIVVSGGSGALIRSSSGGTLGATMLVTDDGMAHGLGVDPSDSLVRLDTSHPTSV